MKLNYSRILMWVAVTAIFCLFCSSCKSKKTVIDKKEEKVSVLQHNDIKTSEKTTADVSTLKYLENQNIIFTPVNKDLPSRIIYGKDTIRFQNTKVEVNNSSSKEIIRDKSVTEKKSSDGTVTRKNKETSSKMKNKESSGTSSGLKWGFILALIVIVIIWILWKRLPFL